MIDYYKTNKKTKLRLIDFVDEKLISSKIGVSKFLS